MCVCVCVCVCARARLSGDMHLAQQIVDLSSNFDDTILALDKEMARARSAWDTQRRALELTAAENALAADKATTAVAVGH